MNRYSVGIIGGGPAGSSCALALMRQGHKDVLLVESGGYTGFRIGETIPPETNRVLQQLDLYDAFLTEGHDPCYGSCSYWGDDRRGYNDSVLSPFGHGWHLDRVRFDGFLAHEAQRAGANVMTHAKFRSSRRLKSGGFCLTLTTERDRSTTVAMDTVVDATGARGLFAAEQGSSRIGTPSLVCLAMRYDLATGNRDMSSLTHLESVEFGWWYAARLSRVSLIVALYADVEAIKEQGLNRTENWLSALQAAPNTGKLVVGLERLDRRPKGFPASSHRLDKFTGRNWLSIGDAASAYDPITSQGILKSMMDGIYAADVLTSDRKSECDAFPEFAVAHANRYEQYLETRQHLYRLETRWPEARFWKKYQGSSERPDTQPSAISHRSERVGM